MTDGSTGGGDAHRHEEGPGLCAGDGAALDALVAAGFDPEQVAPEHRGRAERLCALLGTLESGDGVGADAGIADLIMARIAGQDQRAPALCPDDEDALDALVCEGFRTGRVASGLRKRSENVGALLSLLDSPVEGESDGAGESLVEATLARVQREIDAEEVGLTIEARRGGLRRIGIPDLVSVAAMLLIGIGVLWPVSARFASERERALCQANFQAAGLGFGQYAQDYRAALPMASASPAGQRWWEVGSVERSNSANLFMLVRSGHAELDALACPGNPHAVRDMVGDQHDWATLQNVSYSYQNMFSRERPRWDSVMPGVIAVDRSPVVLRARRGEVIRTLENSPNHGGLGSGRGQNALMSDGSVRWLPTPVLDSGDNVWLPRDLERLIEGATDPRRAAPLEGNESPQGADDAFVGP